MNANFDPAGKGQQQQQNMMYPSSGDGFGYVPYYDASQGTAVDYGGVYSGSTFVGGGEDYYPQTGESGYYPDPTYGEGHPSVDDYSAEPGSFYQHPESPILLPQFYGTPVTAIAYDASYSAMYVASATLSLFDRGPQHRAAMLETRSMIDGSLYASVAGHPEAPFALLSSLYASLYGGGASSSPSTTPSTRRHIPSHAYRPPYGSNLLPDVLASSKGGGNHHMGIQSLVALSGYVASVSPSGARLHTSGGLQVADLHMEGLLCGVANPNEGSGLVTHMTVGGLAEIDKATTNARRKSSLFCVDLYQGLRTVSSGTLDADSDKTVCVTTLASSSSKGSIVAGCSDGYIRLYDGRLRSLAKIKSHVGGVVDIAVSADGNLIASTGYSSSGHCNSPPYYGFPDPNVFLYDIRYLGRGSFPHPFTGVRGGPRYLSFLPVVDGVSANNRLLVASGQSGGGCQILYPFEEQGSVSTPSFLLPSLEQSETVSCLCVPDDDPCLLALGTSQGRILQYKMAGSAKTKTVAQPSAEFRPKGAAISSVGSTIAPPVKKEPLVMPPFQPPLPPISLPASILQQDDPNLRQGATDGINSIFSTFILTTDPLVSALGDPREETKTSFGAWATKPTVASSRLDLSPDLVAKVSKTVDFLQTVPTADLDLDLMADHRPKRIQERSKKRVKPLQNPNKLLYSNKIFSLVYKDTANRRSKLKGKQNRGSGEGWGVEQESVAIPVRYRLTLRPTNRSAASFGYAEYNHTGFLPGWDYPPTMPNAFVPPVLMLLYMIPEVRFLASSAPLSERSPRDKSLLASELSILFHRIDSITDFGMLFPTEANTSAVTRIGAWAPSSFISYVSTMPEAEQLQILDGSPEAVATPRRPEAFYRFLLYQLDKETGKNTPSTRVVDTLAGISFTSVNEFISGSGPPSTSSTRAMTLDMTYDPFLSDAKPEKKPCFGDVLQYNLCREKRLRAWSQQSKSYETIVQRKIATSLPSLLSLSCACAGRKESEGLELWRGLDNESHWLPETIEIELDESGLVVVRELVMDEESGAESWRECRGQGSIPSSVTELISKVRDEGGPVKRRYRLDAVLSMVRDDMDRHTPEEIRQGDAQTFGHHVLHVRVSNAAKKQIFERQRDELETYLWSPQTENVSDMTILGLSSDKSILESRLEQAKARLEALKEAKSTSSWILMNGYVVTDTVVEDAMAFHVKFKEPSLIVFRAVDESDSLSHEPTEYSTLPSDVVRTLSITNGNKSPYIANQKPNVIPGTGDLVAFDAEFVSVQDEESALSDTGSKLTIRETRHALARASVLNCGRRSIVFDDHVLPREPVADYLTRFSGIVANDLNPKHSPHHLISCRAAYLKLRYLMESGCIFVGHGLQQDFWTVNLAVPCSQIIDTLEIYHKPAQRYISLRFLTNFVLKRDMQQDVHDSVEDALAAYELYLRAVDLKKSGDFDKLLDKLYEYGQKTDWKLGMDKNEG